MQPLSSARVALAVLIAAVTGCAASSELDADAPAASGGTTGGSVSAQGGTATGTATGGAAIGNGGAATGAAGNGNPTVEECTAALVTTVEAARSCKTATDCTTIQADCTPATADCAGTAYVNGQQSDAVRTAIEAYRSCAPPVDCALCDRLAGGPACVEGRCVEATEANCPEDGSDCSACTAVTAAVYNPSRDCRYTATYTCKRWPGAQPAFDCFKHQASGELWMTPNQENVREGFESCSSEEYTLAFDRTFNTKAEVCGP